MSVVISTNTKPKTLQKMKTSYDSAKRSPGLRISGAEEVITPSLAQAYLDSSPGNRKISRARVREYAAMMAAGRWVVTSQGIAFDREGRLINGHHRLLAIIVAGATVVMFVARGEDRANFAYLDYVNPRNMSDRTGIPSSVTRILTSALRVSNSRLERDVAATKRLSESAFGRRAAELIEYCPTNARFFSQAPIQAAAVLCSLVSGDSYAFEQYRALVTQDYSAMSSFTSVFCRNAVKGRYETASGSTAVQITFTYAMKVLDRRNSDLTQVKITPDFTSRVQQLMRQWIEEAA
jgi:hypothetical protein